MSNLLKRFYLLAIVVVVAIVGGFYAQYANSRAVVHENATKLAGASAGVLTAQVEGWLTKQAGVVEGAGDFLRLNRWNEADALAYLKELKENNPAFSSLYFVSVDNKMINATGWKPPVDFDLRKRPWYVSAIDANHLVYTEAFLNASRKALIVTIAKPVYGLDGVLLGVVGGDVSVRTVMKIVLDKKVGETGFSFLVDGNESMLAHPYDYSNTQTEVSALSPEYLAAARLAAQSRRAVRIKLEGRDGLLDYRPIRGTAWKLGSFVSLEDLTRDEEQVAAGFFLALLVSVFVLAAMFVLLIRFVIGPLSRLSEGVEQIDAEKLSAYRLPVPGDGEFASVTRKINRLIDKAGNYMEQLEQKVEERTEDLLAANQELIAMNEELSAMNEEIASLNQNLGEMNDTLETRVNERTADLSATLKMQAVLRDISEAALHEAPLQELFAQVHQRVEQVLPAKNFYISLIDDTGNQLVRPYCADETGLIPLQSRVGGGGLTDYVMRLRRAVFVSPGELSRLQDSGELTGRRSNYSSWAGAPLFDSADRVFGTISAFSVGEETRPLQASDLEALTIIAAQVSQAIERHRAAQHLSESEQRFRLAMEFSGTGYLDLDLVQRQLLLSSNWRDRLGFQDQESILTWDTYQRLVHPEDAEARQQSLDSYLQGTQSLHETEYRLRLPDDSWIWVLARFKAVRDEDGTPMRLLGTLSDITELKLREAKEKQRAEQDGLTGVLNRQGLAVKAAAVFSGETGGTLALINIDDFDLINAVHGRDVGDEYLIEFARFLCDRLDKQVHISRFGGDEFILLFTGSESSQLARQAFEAMTSARIQTRAGGFHVHVSCGIADCPTTGCGLDWLVQQADLALKHAKEQGKRRCRFFEPAMLEAVGRRHAIREHLNTALERDELHLVYQPIFDISREPVRAVGYEALLRWNSPVLGVVSPVEFIPVAESTNLILQIGKWVLAEACRFSARWHERTGSHAAVAVNLSAVQLAEPGFDRQVWEILQQTGVPAAALQLEVTESVLMTDLDLNAAVLSKLRAYGIGVSLDDFGTGYSSFTYLAKLPITTLKIDKSLTDAISGEQENKSLPLLKSVFHLANQLGHEVVVEGIETEEQLQALKAIGFSYCQGFLLGRPETEQNLCEAK